MSLDYCRLCSRCTWLEGGLCPDCRDPADHGDPADDEVTDRDDTRAEVTERDPETAHATVAAAKDAGWVFVCLGCSERGRLDAVPLDLPPDECGMCKFCREFTIYAAPVERVGKADSPVSVVHYDVILDGGTP